jgi:hypothetical protein
MSAQGFCEYLHCFLSVPKCFALSAPIRGDNADMILFRSTVDKKGEKRKQNPMGEKEKASSSIVAVDVVLGKREIPKLQNNNKKAAAGVVQQIRDWEMMSKRIDRE